MSLTIVTRLLIMGELLGLKSIQDLLVHEPHVRVITDGSQLIIAVEILSGAKSAAHQTARLRREARRLLESVVQRKLKEIFRLIRVPYTLAEKNVIYCSLLKSFMGMVLT